MGVIRTCLSIFVIWLLFVPVYSHTPVPISRHDSLKQPVRELLNQYAQLSNRLDNKNQETQIREILKLFANPRVQVFNDLETEPASTELSVVGYFEKLLQLYPEGLKHSFTWNTLHLGKPVYDFGERYTVRAEVVRVLQSMPDQSMPPKVIKLAFDIGFYLRDGIPVDLKIMEISHSLSGDQWIHFSAAPMMTRFTNRPVSEDERMTLLWGVGYQSQIDFNQFFSEQWGVSAGLGYGSYQGGVVLDHFDAFLGMDPHFTDVHIITRLHYLVLPVSLIFRSSWKGKFNLLAGVGLSGNIRLYETNYSSAKSDPGGNIYEFVYSEYDWVNQLSRIGLDIHASGGVGYQIGAHWMISLEISVNQGLFGLEHQREPNYSNLKYTGQFNPLFGEPDYTTRLFGWSTGVGISYRLLKD